MTPAASDARPRTAPRLTTAVAAIARNTFREAVRDRVLYLLLVFALLLIAASRLLSMLTVGSEVKIIVDLGLSAISLFGVVTAVFLGVSLVFKEIERRTVYTLLANPVRRWQFLLGKFLGLFFVLACNLVLMSAALFAVLAMRGETPWGLLSALALVLGELAVVTAFALLFSCVTNPILASVGTLAVYVMGHLSWSLEMLADRVPPGAGRTACRALYRVLPNLDRLDVKAEAVHAVPLPDGYVPLALLYALGYSALVLLVACIALERRDFA